MLLFLFPCLVARQIVWVILPLRFVLSLTPMLIFALFFILKAYLRCTESFRKKSDGSRVTFLFLGNNKQHLPVCTKTISSWVWKVLSVAKAPYVSGLSPGGCCFCSLGGWCLSGDHPAGRWLDQSFLHQPGTISLPTLLLQISTRTLCSVPCWASVSRSSLGKCQPLTFNQSCICWAVGP